MTNITLGKRVGALEEDTFCSCEKLTRLTIPASVTNLGPGVFSECSRLIAVYFLGDAPGVGNYSIFRSTLHATVYYLPGSQGWDSIFGDRPAVAWNPEALIHESRFGVRTNLFGFHIAGSSGLLVVVESCTNLARPVWSVAGTCTLSGGTAFFCDPEWTNARARFYRFRWP